MKKTVKIYDCKEQVIGEVDYVDFIDFRIAIIKGEHELPCYVENEHGGLSEIDEYGCISQGKWPFEYVHDKLTEIIKQKKVVEQENKKLAELQGKLSQ